jgi:hypothetical protein
MEKSRPTPILNTTLPPSFRQIRLELAREADYPAGEPHIAYVIVAPLDAEGRIDAGLWKRYHEACRVTRLRPGDDGKLGHLVHRPGGSWAFKYDVTDDVPEEVGYHFADERFVFGEYVSINEEGRMHTFRVVSVQHLL